MNVTPTGKRRTGVVARLHPNEDLLEAIEAVALQATIEAATVRSSIGSLVGACLDGPNGRIEVRGPAVEVIDMVGEVCPDDQGNLRATARVIVVDIDGLVHAGEVVRGLNPVALTFELTLETWRTPFGV